jgi:hypothetical protein
MKNLIIPIKHFLITNLQLLITIALLHCTTATPLMAQNFETLLQELSGSQADQLEGERENQQKKEGKPLPLSTELISPPEEDELARKANIITKGVNLHGLDKQTARVFITHAALGQTIEFGTLKIIVHHCEKTPPEERQDSMAFVTITEDKPNIPPQQLFSGWMFASSPALSCLDHPTYDIWIKECKD